jgi:dienelactone hydrolase
MLTTPAGTRYAVLGSKPAAPAPTLLVFGGDRSSTLLSEDVNEIGRLLAAHGFLSVSLDIPCHGEDVRPGEQAGLAAWRDRVVAGENIMAPFTTQVSDVLDHLISEKDTDPDRIVISGTSRGGFCALHAAAADARIRTVLAFAPVTHLPVLSEFEGARENALALELSTIHLAEQLAGKSIWMTIGNADDRVGTTECIELTQAIVRQIPDRSQAIPVELHILGTVDHRLHARRAPAYRQWSSPHEDAAEWVVSILEQK